MTWRCRILGHKWPHWSALPEASRYDPIAIRCARCHHSMIVNGWVRLALAAIDTRDNNAVEDALRLGWRTERELNT